MDEGKNANVPKSFLGSKLGCVSLGVPVKSGTRRESMWTSVQVSAQHIQRTVWRTALGVASGRWTRQTWPALPTADERLCAGPDCDHPVPLDLPCGPAFFKSSNPQRLGLGV